MTKPKPKDEPRLPRGKSFAPGTDPRRNLKGGGRWRRSAPVEAQEVEGDEGGLAALGQERVEVAAPVVPEQIFARAVASG